MNTDEEIRKNVIDEIAWDPQLAAIASKIGVVVRNEVVTLSGRVDSYVQKTAAEQAAERVRGVKVVAVDIEVSGERPSDFMLDAEIAQAARQALAWHSAVNEDLVNVKVDNGYVYLEGTANFDYERKAAGLAVANLRGIKGVANLIKLQERLNHPAEVKRKIREAFLRHATVDSNSVDVDVINHRVILKGKVSSLAERKDAEEVAWAMPGTVEVDNQLVVDSEIYTGV